jgi:hypothetical protein
MHHQFNISTTVRSAFTVFMCFEDRGVHRVFVGKPEGKTPLEKTRLRWKDNIKMDLQEVGGGVVENGWSWLRIGTSGGHLWVR